MMAAPRGGNPVRGGVLHPFAVSVHSDSLAVREALRRLLVGLAPLNLDPEELSSFELVLAEILNNIVEHAYPEGADAGTIDIVCSQATNGLHIVIRDRGRPMKGDRLPEIAPRDLDVAHQELPEGGFGWLMIGALTRDMTYRRVGDENHLSFRIAIGL